MLRNNQPNKSCELNLQLYLIFSDRAPSSLVLRSIIDDNLKWSLLIYDLSLQLSRYSGIFYRIRNLIPFKVTKMLYSIIVLSAQEFNTAL